MEELWRRPVVEEKTGLKRSALYAAMSAGRFPKPVRLGENSVAWIAGEVQAWIKARINERDQADKAK
jgi:prophage regulatory protein